jgi:hypothetical protein
MQTYVNANKAPKYPWAKKALIVSLPTKAAARVVKYLSKKIFVEMKAFPTIRSDKI